MFGPAPLSAEHASKCSQQRKGFPLYKQDKDELFPNLPSSQIKSCWNSLGLILHSALTLLGGAQTRVVFAQFTTFLHLLLVIFALFMTTRVQRSGDSYLPVIALIGLNKQPLLPINSVCSIFKVEENRFYSACRDWPGDQLAPVRRFGLKSKNSGSDKGFGVWTRIY